MSKLNPELKRLMAWSGRAAPGQPEEAPFGFASRVVARWSPKKARTLFFELQQLVWPSVLVSVAVIVGGMLVMLNQARLPEPASAFSSALPFLMNNLTP